MIENNRYYWSHLKTRNVTVRVRTPERRAGAVFRVCNLIDVGNGRQTIVLQEVEPPQTEVRKILRKRERLSVPMRMGHLDFVYTSRKTPCIRNIQSLISSVYKDARLERIVTDVIAPGDLLVFHQEGEGTQIKLAEALRIVKQNEYRKNQVEYAL